MKLDDISCDFRDSEFELNLHLSYDIYSEELSCVLWER